MIIRCAGCGRYIEVAPDHEEGVDDLCAECVNEAQENTGFDPYDENGHHG